MRCRWLAAYIDCVGVGPAAEVPLRVGLAHHDLTMMLAGGIVLRNLQRLSQISLGMTKGEVIQVIGSPYTVRGAVTNKYGQSVEVWEVVLSQPKTGRQLTNEVAVTALTFGLLSPVLATPGKEVAYWLYFVNGRLAQWGEAGDWRREADRIYEIRFGSADQLTR